MLKYQINLQSDRPLNEHSSYISSPLSTDRDEDEDKDDDDCKVEDFNPQVVIDF